MSTAQSQPLSQATIASGEQKFAVVGQLIAWQVPATQVGRPFEQSASTWQASKLPVKHAPSRQDCADRQALPQVPQL